MQQDLDSRRWLAELIAYDTTSRNSNLTLIDRLQDWLHTQGCMVRLSYDANRNKANLLATLAANDGSLDGGLVFSGHTDVVPVDGQQWETNPFRAHQTQDRIYGRGAC